MGWREDLEIIAYICAAVGGNALMLELELERRAASATSGDPDEIGRLADGWGSAAGRVADHAKDTDRAVTDAMVHWEGDAASNFQNCMGYLVDVLNRHHNRAKEISNKLGDAKDAIDQAIRAVDELMSETSSELENVLISMGGGAIAGSPGGIVGAIAGALGGAIASVISNALAKADDIEKARDEKIQGVVDAIGDIGALLEGDKVDKLDSPPPPTIVTAPSLSSDEFESRHQPPELDRVTVSTTPPQFGGDSVDRQPSKAPN